MVYFQQMMPCRSCGHMNNPEARFCRHCGAALSNLLRHRPQYVHERTDWHSFDTVMRYPDRQLAGLGAILAFCGAFVPWTEYSVSFFGFEYTYSYASPQSLLIAVCAMLAAVFLFHRRGGVVLLVTGLLIAACAFFFGVSSFGGASPSWGVVLTLVGGILLAFSGYRLNQSAS